MFELTTEQKIAVIEWMGWEAKIMGIDHVLMVKTDQGFAGFTPWRDRENRAEMLFKFQEKSGIGVSEYNKIEGSENRWQATKYSCGMIVGTRSPLIHVFGATPQEALLKAVLVLAEFEVEKSE